MKNLLRALSALLLIATFSGCGKHEDRPASTSTSTPAITGSLVGYVDLYDQYGNILNNAGGVTVTLSNSTVTATTDANGRYVLPSLPIGYYNIYFSKSGFGNAESTSQQVIASDTLYLTGRKMLSQMPTFSISTMTLGFNKAMTNLDVNGLMNALDPKTRRIIFFVNDSSVVSSSPANYKYSFTTSVLPDSVKYGAGIAISTLYGAGFASGSTIYIAAYSSAYQNGSSTTFNANFGRNQYNAISTGNPLIGSITLP